MGSRSESINLRADSGLQSHPQKTRAEIWSDKCLTPQWDYRKSDCKQHSFSYSYWTAFVEFWGKQHVFLTSYWTAHVELSIVDSYFFIDCTDSYIYDPGEMRKALTMEEQINQVKSINQ